MRRELEEQASQHEQSVNSMRAKQNQAMQELQDEMDSLKKAKSKYVTLTQSYKFPLQLFFEMSCKALLSRSLECYTTLMLGFL